MKQLVQYLKKYRLPGLGILIVLICIVIAVIYHKNAAARNTQEESDTVASAPEAEPSITPNITPITVPTVTPTIAPAITAAVTPAPAAEVTEYDYDLYSLNFLDEKNGWVILWNYNDPVVHDTTSLLHTRDGGTHWETYESKDRLLQKVAFADRETGWAVALEGHPSLSDGNTVTYQILQTQDGGENWSLQFSCKAEYGISCEIAVYSKDSACAVIGGQIYRTGDSGQNWTLVESPAKDFTAEHVFFADEVQGWISGVIRTGENSEVNSESDTTNNFTVCIYHTKDGGSWQQQFSEDCGNEWNETVGISFADTKNGWFLTRNFGTLDGLLYHTTDGGKQWEMVNKQRVCRPYAQEVEAVTPEVLWIPMHNGAGPIDGGLLRSVDGGKSFTQIGTEAGIVNSNDADFVTSSLGWAIMNGYPGVEKYLIKTADGGDTWEKVPFTP